MRIRTKIGLLVGGLLATQAATLAASGWRVADDGSARRAGTVLSARRWFRQPGRSICIRYVRP